MIVALDRTRPAEWSHHRSPYVRILLVVLAIHLVLFVMTPPFQFKPYELEAEEYMVVQEIREFEIPKPVKEVPLPVHIEPGYIGPPVDVDVPATSIDNLEDLVLPPKVGTTPGSRYVPYDKRPEAVHFVRPVYPELAREAGIEGTVAVRVVIDTEGKVVDATVVASDVTPAMERAALAAARKCTFIPAEQQGKPVKVAVIIPFEFRLND
jgi:protein TonB